MNLISFHELRPGDMIVDHVYRAPVNYGDDTVVPKIRMIISIVRCSANRQAVLATTISNGLIEKQIYKNRNEFNVTARTTT